MDLRRVAARVAGQLSSAAVPFTGPVAEAAVSDLLEIQNEQLAMLAKLDSSVLRLIDGPWRSAEMHLKDAALHGRTSKQIEHSLSLAAEKLHDAIPLQVEGTIARAQARLDLAIVLFLLQDEPAARHHAGIAYQEIRSAAHKLVNDRDVYLKKQFYGPITRFTYRDTDPAAWNTSWRLQVKGWYYQAEWSSALLGDPRGKPGPLPNPDDDNEVSWRQGEPVDFHYIDYKLNEVVRVVEDNYSTLAEDNPSWLVSLINQWQWRVNYGHLGEFLGRSWEEVLNARPPTLPSPRTLYLYEQKVLKEDEERRKRLEGGLPSMIRRRSR
jgi:hypothetical protein